MPHETAEASLRHARSMAATSVLNAAPIRPWMTDLAALADIVVVNELERDALGSSPRAAGQVLIETLGRRGARATTDEGVIEVPGLDVPVVDTTGAGDCFVGALAARLDAGDPLLEALHYANRAAAVSVGRTGAGTSLPTANEVSAGQ
jgi:ribokinase